MIVGGILFACGLFAGAALSQLLIRHGAAPADFALTAKPAGEVPVPSAAIPIAQRLDRRIVYPADVLRVIDGDTFEARVRVWPGLDVDTKVRLHRFAGWRGQIWRPRRCGGLDAQHRRCIRGDAPRRLGARLRWRTQSWLVRMTGVRIS